MRNSKPSPNPLDSDAFGLPECFTVIGDEHFHVIPSFDVFKATTLIRFCWHCTHHMRWLVGLNFTPNARAHTLSLLLPLLLTPTCTDVGTLPSSSSSYLYHIAHIYHTHRYIEHTQTNRMTKKNAHTGIARGKNKGENGKLCRNHTTQTQMMFG